MNKILKKIKKTTIWIIRFLVGIIVTYYGWEYIDKAVEKDSIIPMIVAFIYFAGGYSILPVIKYNNDEEINIEECNAYCIGMIEESDLDMTLKEFGVKSGSLVTAMEETRENIKLQKKLFK